MSWFTFAGYSVQFRRSLPLRSLRVSGGVFLVLWWKRSRFVVIMFFRAVSNVFIIERSNCQTRSCIRSPLSFEVWWSEIIDWHRVRVKLDAAVELALKLPSAISLFLSGLDLIVLRKSAYCRSFFRIVEFFLIFPIFREHAWWSVGLLCVHVIVDEKVSSAADHNCCC